MKIKKVKTAHVGVVLRQAYQEGHDNDAIARQAAIQFLMEDFNLDWKQAEALHDEHIHKCGLKDTMRKCGEPSWIVESDKCPDLLRHDYFEEVS